MMMTSVRGAGMSRLANPFTFAAMLLASPALTLVAQTATTRVMLRARSDTIVARGDSVRTTVFERPSVIDIRRIDSLLKQQENLPIGSPEYARIQRELESTIFVGFPNGTRTVGADGQVTIMLGPGPGAEPTGTIGLSLPRVMVDVVPRGWLGFTADGFQKNWWESDGFFVQHYEYPSVVEVDPDSPAEKGGVKFGDVLLAYDGLDVRTNPINLTRMLVPGHSVALRVRRDGESKDVSVVVEKAPPAVIAQRRGDYAGRMLIPSRAPMLMDSLDRRAAEVQMTRARAGAKVAGGGFVAARTPNALTMAIPKGYLGASMTDIEPAAYAALTQQNVTNGVLVTAVTAGTPAARMGLLGGDLIVSVGDVAVMSLAQLYRELSWRGSDRVTQISVLRKGKIEKLTYEPR